MTRLYLDSLEKPVFQMVCLFFIDSKKNRPIQGHVAPSDYDGRFQGSTSMRVDDAAFGYGCWPLLEWLSLSNEVTLRIAEHRRSLSSSPMHGAMSWHGAARTNHRCLDVLSTGSISGPAGCQRSNASNGRGPKKKGHLFDRPTT
jgi:hypothetical protein